MTTGWIVILNGVPRSGKTSIAKALQELSPEPWVNIGVDVAGRTLPLKAWPGIGLRPGGERPDLEPLVASLYAALFESIAAHARAGINVVSDLGLHDGYSRPLHILDRAVRALDGLPVLFVAVRCPLDEIMRRRDREPEGSGYQQSLTAGKVPEPVRRWQDEVHGDHVYDLEVETSKMSPEECAEAVVAALQNFPSPSAFERLRTKEE